MEDAKVKTLEEELASGIKTLRGLANRNAEKEMITYQTKIIQGTLNDLIAVICGKELDTTDD